MKGNTFGRLLAAVAFTAVGAMTAWAVPQPDPECVGKIAGEACRPATTCSDAALCTANLKCPTGPVNPENYNGVLCESDNNACTQDVCAGGQCRHNPINCPDGDACTTVGCDPLKGCVSTPKECPGGSDCQIATCDPIEGCGLAYITNDCGTATCGTSHCGTICGPPCSTACIPVITCPSDQTVECVDGAGQNTLGAATATCDGEVTNNGDASYPFTCGGSNSHEVTYTATSDGGSTSCTATLTVEDTEKPTATCGASVTVRTSEQGGTCSASLTPSASGTDACEGALTGTCDPDELMLSGPGTAPATCTVEDCSGNISDSCTQSLTLIDDTAPTITCAAPYVTPPLAPMSWTASTVTDNCGGATTTNVTSVDCYLINGSGKLVSKLAACKASYSGNTVSIGPSAGGVGTIIKWTVSAKDASGNTSTATCMTQVQNPGLTKP